MYVNAGINIPIFSFCVKLKSIHDCFIYLEFYHKWSNYIHLIVPDTIHVDYCEYTLDENCFEIDNIIQPAPYYYVGQTDMYDQLVKLNESLEIILILVIILIITVPIVVLGSKYVKNSK